MLCYFLLHSSNLVNLDTVLSLDTKETTAAPYLFVINSISPVVDVFIQERYKNDYFEKHHLEEDS